MSRQAVKTMTQAEFSKGWKLLIIQPWGWRYNQTDESGQPTAAAMTQMEFYFEKLQWAHPTAWLDVARTYAQGESWPSVNELRQALHHVNGKYVSPLADHRPGVPMPQPVREMLDRLSEKCSMVKEGKV